MSGSALSTGTFWMIAVAGAVLAAIAPVRADVETGVRKYQSGDFAGAIAEWLPHAAMNDPPALYNLGQSYRLGKGVSTDLKIAADYYERAARYGHVAAMSNLASLYYFSEPPLRDRKSAVMWWKAASQAGDSRARYMMSVLYSNGEEVAQDRPRAYALAYLAAKDGLVAARTSADDMKRRLTDQEVRNGHALAALLASSTATAEVRLASSMPKPAPVAEVAIADLSKVAPAARPSQTPRAMASTSAEPRTMALLNDAKASAASMSTARKPSIASALSPKADGKWRVQMGAFSDVSAARLAWTGALATQGQLLRGLQPTFAAADGLTKLQIGAFGGRVDAATLCSKLQSAGMVCFVTRANQ